MIEAIPSRTHTKSTRIESEQNACLVEQRPYIQVSTQLHVTHFKKQSQFYYVTIWGGGVVVSVGSQALFR